MNALSTLTKILLPTYVLLLTSCQMTDLAKNSFGLTSSLVDGVANNVGSEGSAQQADPKSLDKILLLKDVSAHASPKINVDAGFSKAVSSAVRSDPKVQMAKAEVLKRQARLGVTKSQLDFQFSGTFYAGVEDVTDEANGLAAVLNASRLLYDGGQVLNAVSADEYAVQSALEWYKATLNKSAFEVGSAWVELERYQMLNTRISDRLAVLDPLINQLEVIADAGVGDATQVAVAQRTVSLIRVTQTDVEDRLAQAELDFVRLLGSLPGSAFFDAAAIAEALPIKAASDMAMAAPDLLAHYAAYLNALSSLDAVKARNSFTIGLESKVQRPFGQSGYDSDESIGIVVRKTFYNGNKFSSEVKSSQAEVDRQEASVKDAYRLGKETIESSMQNITSMEKAIRMSRSNAKALNDEIALLRKQLVIGQSTLDSVLSAEARLYDAEAKEIDFTASKRISQLGVLSAIGSLSSVVGIKFVGEF